MMVGWIAFLFGLTCFFVCFFSLSKVGPALEGEHEKELQNAIKPPPGKADFWGFEKRAKS